MAAGQKKLKNLQIQGWTVKIVVVENFFVSKWLFRKDFNDLKDGPPKKIDCQQCPDNINSYFAKSLELKYKFLCADYF